MTLGGKGLIEWLLLPLHTWAIPTMLSELILIFLDYHNQIQEYYLKVI
jgi:hypothetical protein